MSAQIIKYLTVFFSSSVKFFFGPVEGLALGLSWMETASLTAGGMMFSVILFTYFGKFLKEKVVTKIFKKKKLFTSAHRRNVRLWKRFGIYGVAFLTPLLLTPIGGTLLATSFGEKRFNILIWMLTSAIFWGITFTIIVFQAEDFLRRVGILS